mgnify:CR=1 FL=1
MLTPGTVLQNRYRIASLLGQGGMGAVYRAWDLRLNIPVAVKEMVPQPGIDPQTIAQLRQQFYQEAQILARLNHPNLVRVTDYFEEGGNAYLRGSHRRLARWNVRDAVLVSLRCRP